MYGYARVDEKVAQFLYNNGVFEGINLFYAEIESIDKNIVTLKSIPQYKFVLDIDIRKIKI
jgi:hypothetical protein